MNHVEMTFLAGGAALSLLAGAVAAQFGLGPLNAALRQEARADVTAFAHPTFGVGQDPIAEADPRPGEQSALYSTDVNPPAADAERKMRRVAENVGEATLTSDDRSRGADADTRDDGEAAGDGRSAVAPWVARTGNEAGAAEDPRGGQPADEREPDGTSRATWVERDPGEGRF